MDYFFCIALETLELVLPKLVNVHISSSNNEFHPFVDNRLVHLPFDDMTLLRKITTYKLGKF